MVKKAIAGTLTKEQVYEADENHSSHQDGNHSSHYYNHKTNKQRGVTSRRQLDERTLIFKDRGLKHGFAQVPTVVLRDPLMDTGEKTLYALLLSYAWQDHECFPGQETLATDIGYSRRYVSCLLSKLRTRKLITWKRQGLGKVNIYYIERLDNGYLPKQYID